MARKKKYLEDRVSSLLDYISRKPEPPPRKPDPYQSTSPVVPPVEKDAPEVRLDNQYNDPWYYTPLANVLGVGYMLALPTLHLTLYRGWMLDVVRDNYEPLSDLGLEWLVSPMANGLVEGAAVGAATAVVGLGYRYMFSGFETNRLSGGFEALAGTVSTVAGCVGGFIGGMFGQPEGVLWGAYVLSGLDLIYTTLAADYPE